jgi:SHS2 domain-containing protein
VHRWVEHTAELELELEADSAEGVFVEVLTALAELWREHAEDGPGVASGDSVRLEVELESPDRATLLADWIEELCYSGEVRGTVPERVAELDLREDGLSAVLECSPGRAPPVVKAVTYHGLSFERQGERWRARVVLDV